MSQVFSRAAAALFLLTSLACGGSSGPAPATPTPTSTPAVPPNLVIILADDMGWGDLSSFGSPTIDTPNIDRLGSEGVRLQSFYVPSSVCAPSRAALMTGRWGVRVGIPWNPPIKLNAGEITLAQALKAQGYATGMIGKWHLGWRGDELPLHHGFDSYYGLPAGEDPSDFIRGDQPTSDAVPLDQVARKYTDEAIDFVQTHKSGPFFLYLAHRSPHLPNYPANEFLGRSAGGSYGDTVVELDFHIGRLMDALQEAGVAQNTVVLFTSDNGPPAEGGGSTGPFSGHKQQVGEGAVRVPALLRWPARVPAGRAIDEPTSTLDVFPTFLSLAQGQLPTDRVYDGGDITKLLTGEVSEMPGPGLEGHREIVFWNSTKPAAIRSGKWKFARPYSRELPPSLFDLAADPSELHNLWVEQPELQATAQQLDARLTELTKGF